MNLFDNSPTLSRQTTNTLFDNSPTLNSTTHQHGCNYISLESSLYQQESIFVLLKNKSPYDCIDFYITML